MSYKIIHRGAPRNVSKDFICPTHGKFTAVVGSNAETAWCPVVTSSGDVAGPREPGDPYVYESRIAMCGELSPWSPSLIPMRMARAQATTGKSETPDHRDWDFTRNLEEGQSPDEWEADREAAAERRREQFVYDAVRED